MSKLLILHTALLASFETIGFNSEALLENPDALAEFMAAQKATGGDDLKARIETLEGENATLSETAASASTTIDKLTADLDTKTSEATLFTDRCSVYAKGVTASGVKLEAKDGGAEHTSEDISAAIKTRVDTRAAEQLAALGHPGLLLQETPDSDEDPLAGLTGSARTAAALKARRLAS